MTKTLPAILLAIAFIAAPLQAWGQCTSDTDCKGGRTCRAGGCVWSGPGCSRDVDCPGDQICNDGACGAARALTPPARPTPSASPPPAGYVQPSSTAPPTAPTTGFVQPTAPGSQGPGAGRLATTRKRISWLWITGLTVFSVDYLAGIAVAVADTCDSERAEAIGVMAIPLLGPFIRVASNECSGADDYAALTVMAGVVQALAATAFIVGLSVTREVPLTTYALSDDPNGPLLTLAPGVVGQSGFGLNVALTRF